MRFWTSKGAAGIGDPRRKFDRGLHYVDDI